VGLFVVIPLVRPGCNWLHARMGWVPLFGTDLSGPGMLPAVIVLSIMILPTITAISRGALVAVPPKLRMAAYGLGATRWEAILAVILPTASQGIFGGVVLAFGRALGETMALAMLVGNANVISVSLFSPANTLAALLANAFPEARPKDVGVLMYAAMALLAITLLVNVAAAYILRRTSSSLEGARHDTREPQGECRNRAGPSGPRTRPVSRRRLFEVGAVAGAAADVHEHVVDRDHDGDDVVRPDPAVLGSIAAAVAGGRKLSMAAFTQLPPAPLEQAAVLETPSWEPW